MYQLRGTVSDSPPKQCKSRILTTESGRRKAADLCSESQVLNSSEVTSALHWKTKVAMKEGRKVQKIHLYKHCWSIWLEMARKVPLPAFTSISKDISQDSQHSLSLWPMQTTGPTFRKLRTLFNTGTVLSVTVLNL